jgi:hypothetical protein
MTLAEEARVLLDKKRRERSVEYLARIEDAKKVYEFRYKEYIELTTKSVEELCESNDFRDGDVGWKK